MAVHRVAVVLAVLAGPAPTALGAELSIYDTNAPGKGLNDPTPATPVGLNFGTTRGEQALIALQYAASIWEATVRSTVPVVIDSAFVTPEEDARLACTGNAGILAITSVPSFLSAEGLPVPSANYPVALANALLGTDLTPGEPHIISRFNASVGTPGCLQNAGFYYGLVGAQVGAQEDLVSVFLHEFAHGLGFLSVVDAASGHFESTPSIFDFHVWDVAAGTTWQAESDAQRQALSEGVNALALEGPALAAAIPAVLAFLPTFSVDAPGFKNPVPFAEATFSGPFVVGAGTLVAAQPIDGCTDFTNAASLAGNIALIERGGADGGSSCHFWDKANRAQDAGAAAVVLFNNQPGAPLLTPTGSPMLSIPVGFVSLETGTAIAEQAGARGVFGQSSVRPGVDDSGSRVLLYTPSTVASASSVSHFGTGSSPALLMEPSIQASVMRRLDLTPAVLADLGWPLVQGLSVVVAKALEQQIYPNQDTSYLLTLVNRRPVAASGVTLDLMLPAGSSIVSTAGACPNGVFPCSLGTVPPGAVLLTVVTLHVPTEAPNPFVVTATAGASTPDGEDVLASTSTLPAVNSTGCSSTAGAPMALGLGLLWALVSLRRRL